MILNRSPVEPAITSNVQFYAEGACGYREDMREKAATGDNNDLRKKLYGILLIAAVVAISCS